MPIIISHRGLYFGSNKSRENNPVYIKELLKDNIPCEIDLRIKNNKLYLGHDFEQYRITLDFLVENRNLLYVHAKTINALYWLANTAYDLHYFYHTVEDAVLTSKKFIWQAHYNDLTPKTIVIDLSITPRYNSKCWGICCDYLK